MNLLELVDCNLNGSSSGYVKLVDELISSLDAGPLSDVSFLQFWLN